MDQDFKPQDVPTLTPYLSVIDAQRSLDFYQKAFGFELRSEPMRDENGKLGHCEMGFHGAVIMFAPESNWGTFSSSVQMKAPISIGPVKSIALYVYCPNVDEFYRQAVAAGAKTISGPQDAFWGDRYCSLEDIDGHTWTFATMLGK